MEGKSKDYKDFEDMGEYKVQFALGAVQGSIAHDRICIGNNSTETGDSGSKGCIGKPVKFLKANNATQMDNYKCSGFVGLAPKSLIQGQKSFI